MAWGRAGKVEICGINTAQLPTLTSQENQKYLSAMAHGDETARQKLITGNLRLVLSIIQRFSSRTENMDDLFQVGCVGLIKSIDHFDITAGVQLSTYAVPMIIGEIRRYLRDNNAIRVSRNVRDLAYQALKAKETLSERYGREPTLEEIAVSLSCTPGEVSCALEAIVEPISLFEPVYNDGGDSIYVMDQISDPCGTDDAWLDDIALCEALKKLSEREKKIIRMRFFLGRTQMEIASEIGISQAQVSRLEKGALARLKKDF